MAGQVRIDVRMWEFVSFAMAHNSIEFVKGVKLSGLPDDLETVSVSVVLTDRGVPLSRPWVDGAPGPRTGRSWTSPRR